MRPVLPIEYRFTQAQIDAGVANFLAGVRVAVVDANGVPTGKIYESGAAGATPTEIGGAPLTAAQIDALNKISVTSTVRGIPNFTAPTAAGTLGTYTASASSEFAPAYAAWTACQAAQGIATSEWATAGISSNFWIKMQFPSAKIATQIRVAGRINGTEMPSAGWMLQASNDNLTWTTLYTGVAAMTATLTTFSFTNTTAYTYYRIFCPTGVAPNPGMSAFWLYENLYGFAVPV